MSGGRLLRWRRPVLVDGTLAAFLFLLGLSHPIATHQWALIPLRLALAAPLAVRRRYPIQVFVVVCLAAFVQWLIRADIGSYDAAVLVALYSVAAYRSHQWSGPALVIGLTGGSLAWSRAHVERGPGPLGLLVPTVVVVAVWLVGRTMRTRRSYLAELEQRAVRLERERDALARAAVAEERARIAREMHDVVAHSVAVMVAQAEGASVVVRSAPDAAERALEVISDAGRKALSELRRTLGVLRESNAADTAPQPGLADLDLLVASMRSSGLPVRFRREGADDPVPPTMALAVYRIVQESLTNTLKHAGPRTPTQLLLRRTPGTLEVDVTDLGLGPGLDPGFGPLLDPGFKGHGPSGEGQGLTGEGQGLTGIHERVSMFGGEVLSGPTPGGGWRVHALLPIPIP